MGPLLFNVLRNQGFSQAAALTPLVGMFALGFVLVLTVNEPRGIARAEDRSSPIGGS